MVTCVTRSELPSYKVKIKYSVWLLIGYLLVTCYNQTSSPSISEVLKKSSVLHRMTLAMPILPICGMA